MHFLRISPRQRRNEEFCAKAETINPNSAKVDAIVVEVQYGAALCCVV